MATDGPTNANNDIIPTSLLGKVTPADILAAL